MIYIAHRVNTVVELKKIPNRYGVELDLRDSVDGRIYIQHNPFEQGEDFENYLKEYRHGMMILNVKSERIEEKVLELLGKYNIKEYFFLDSSFPMIMQMVREKEHNIALRYSEYEGMDTLINMQGLVKWVWVDCFERFPLNKPDYLKLKEMGYKLCMVSPELQGRDGDIEVYAKVCRENGMIFDAVCTKHYNIERWKKGMGI